MFGSVAGTVILGYALAAGPNGNVRQHAALWIFATAFLISAALGAALRTRYSRVS